MDPLSWIEHPGPQAFLVLFGSNVVEYVFPPFPGDTVTVMGAFLVTARGWPWWWVLLATTSGSLVGASLAWRLGLAGRRRGFAEPKALGSLVEGFSRHGPLYILINRFFPGVRALFFVAAGMAGMKVVPTLFFAFLSALLWNGLLLIAGMAAGSSWPLLLSWFGRYGLVMWSLVVLLAVLAVLRWRWASR